MFKRIQSDKYVGMCGNRYILLRWRVNQPTERHFKSRGHKFSDMCATILEKVYSNDDLLRGKGIDSP